MSNKLLIGELIIVKEFMIDLIVFDMFEFDIILEIDFLRRYRVEIECQSLI